LEESHARREEDRHDPELSGACKAAIQRVDKQYQEQVDVKCSYGSEEDLEIAYSDAKGRTAAVKDIELAGEDDCVDDGSDDIGDA
jgi:hypothetical protein